MLRKEKALHQFYVEISASSQMNPCFSLFLVENGIELSVPKTKGANQTFTSDPGIEVHYCKRYG